MGQRLELAKIHEGGLTHMKKIWSSLLIFAVLALGMANLSFAEKPMEAVAAGVTLTATDVTSTITVFAGSALPCSKAKFTNPDPTFVVFVTQAANTYTANTQYWFPIPPNMTVELNQLNDGTLNWYGKVSPTPKTIATGYYSTKPSKRNPWY
jgi:hypothetical protein